MESHRPEIDLQGSKWIHRGPISTPRLTHSSKKLNPRDPQSTPIGINQKLSRLHLPFNAKHNSQRFNICSQMPNIDSQSTKIDSQMFKINSQKPNLNVRDFDRNACISTDMIKLLTEMFEIFTEMFMILLEMLVILTQSTKPSLT